MRAHCGHSTSRRSRRARGALNFRGAVVAHRSPQSARFGNRLRPLLGIGQLLPAFSGPTLVDGMAPRGRGGAVGQRRQDESPLVRGHVSASLQPVGFDARRAGRLGCRTIGQVFSSAGRRRPSHRCSCSLMWPAKRPAQWTAVWPAIGLGGSWAPRRPAGSLGCIVGQSSSSGASRASGDDRPALTDAPGEAAASSAGGAQDASGAKASIGDRNEEGAEDEEGGEEELAEVDVEAPGDAK